MNERGIADSIDTRPERILYIDWLRVLAMLTIFYFHNARFFDLEDWHVKNEEVHVGFMVFVGFINGWIMPLFFLLSGTGSLFALRRRSNGQYLAERFKRLVIPYLMGIFVLIPPQRYVEALSNARFSGSYPEFYKRVVRFDYLDWNFNFLGHYGTHLWFLGLLFFLSLTALPLFRYLERETGKHFILQAAAASEKRCGIFLFTIPLALVQVALRARFPGECDWANFFYYLLFFLYGYILFADGRFTHAIRKQGLLAFAIGILCFAGIAIWFFAGNLSSLLKEPGYSIPFTLLQLLLSLNAWAWIVFIISVAIRFLDFSNKGLEYSNEAVLPFYILHQTVILLIGFYVVQWKTGMLVKYLVISMSALIVTLALYDLVVKRINGIRFLFGMRLKTRAGKC